MNKRLLLVASAVTALAVAAGCGGGGSSLTPSQSHGSGTGTESVTIKIPGKTHSTSSSKRSPQYVSPDTLSVSFSVNQGAAQIVSVGPGASGCTGDSEDGYTCTTSFQAPVGSGQSVLIKTYSAANAGGSVLSQVTQSFDVTAGGPNTITFTLSGVAKTYVVTVDPTSITSGTAASGTVTWIAQDAAGDTIIGPGALINSSGAQLPDEPTIAIAPDLAGGSTGTYTPNKASDNSVIGGQWVITYDGTPTTNTSETITVSSTGVTSGTATMTINGASPTASPSPTPSGAPVNAVSNGDFETGSLSPWYACTFTHTGVQYPVNPSPVPSPVSTQNPAAVYTPEPAGQLAPFATVTSAPPNYNPNQTANTPSNLGSYSGLAGAIDGSPGAATGLCQAVTVPTDGQLSFMVYEGGNGSYAFYAADQEAMVYDSSGTNILDTLFMEQNCYYDPAHLGIAGQETSQCYVGGSGTAWVNGGYWVPRGPYDLSAYAGQNVILYFGVWNKYYDAPPNSSGYQQYMFVDNVSLTGSGGAAPSPSPTAPVNITISGGAHR